MHKTSSALHFVNNSPRANLDGDAHWSPNTDVYSTPTGLVIKVELAGIKPGDLALTMEGNRLRISGNRPDGCRAAKCTFLVMEINYGAFESVIELPPGYDLSQATGAYQNGFLRIDVPVTKPTETNTNGRATRAAKARASK